MACGRATEESPGLVSTHSFNIYLKAVKHKVFSKPPQDGIELLEDESAAHYV